MKLKPYPEYKESGIPGIGSVPAHWSIFANRRLFRETTRKYQGENEVQLSLSQRDGLIATDRLEEKTLRTASYDNFKVCVPDDLVLNRFKAHLGVFFASTLRGIVTFHYGVFRPLREMKTRYFEILFHTNSYKAIYSGASNGMTIGLQNLSNQNFYKIPSVVPPLSEQVDILRFCTVKEQQIRRLIRAKRRLIDLLNEQKQAIIHRAVTRGLDPDVRLKPSGIDWIGNVPEHWTANRLKYVAQVQTGITLGKQYTGKMLEERPYLRVANVQDGHLKLSEITQIRVPSADALRCELQPGDVLMTEGGDIDKLGRGAIWKGEIPGCLHQNHVFAVRPNRNILLPDFLTLLMTSIHGRNYFLFTAKQTTNLASTNSTTLKSFSLLLPHLDEQRQMINFVLNETLILNQAIADAKREIDLLREYRTRLIADVVTGKLDVRGVQLPTLDQTEAEAPQDLDEDADPEEASLDNAVQAADTDE